MSAGAIGRRCLPDPLSESGRLFVSNRSVLNLVLVSALLGALVLTGCASPAQTEAPAETAAPEAAPEAAPQTDAAPDLGAPKAELDQTTELKIEELVEGSGAEAKAGDNVTVHYTGWTTDGAMFDSSLNSGQPFPFQLGTGYVIKGWDEGVQGMKVGGKRRLVIPSTLGYGQRGAGGLIPPGAALIFDVELVDTRAGAG
jgi:FKBP-type peptidyl-prolyl cis-trans isomerase